MKDDADRLMWFMPTLQREIDAFARTRTKHDQQRVIKALGYLEDTLAELRKEVSSVQLSTENDE